MVIVTDDFRRPIATARHTDGVRVNRTTPAPPLGLRRQHRADVVLMPATHCGTMLDASPRSSVPLRAIVVLACAALISACSGDRAPSPITTPIAPPPVRAPSLRVTAPSATVAAYDSITLSATREESSYPTVNLTSLVTWSSSDSTVATVLRDGTVVGERPGTVTVRAVGPSGVGSDSIRGSVTLSVTAPRVVALRLRDSVLVMPLADSAVLVPAVALDRRGGVVLLSGATWDVTSSAAASVAPSVDSSSGPRVRTLREGDGVLTVRVRTATPMASTPTAGTPAAPWFTATVRAQVSRTTTQVLGISPAIFRPGSVVEVRGLGLNTTQLALNGVTLDGVTLDAQVRSDSLLRGQVPAALYAPCLAGGMTGVLRVTGARTSSVARPVERPWPVALTVGVPVYPSEAIARGCALEVTTPGRVAGFAYTWDADFDPTADRPPPSVSLPLRVLLGNGTTAALSALSTSINAQSAIAAAQARYTKNSQAPPSFIRELPLPTIPLQSRANRSASSGAQLTAPTVCRVSSTEGDDVPVWTNRTADGAMQAVGAKNLGKIEPWRVLVVSPTVTVLIDTAALARMTPATLTAFREYVAAMDSTVMPLFSRDLQMPIPENSASGRLIVFAPSRTISGFSGIAINAMVGNCTDFYPSGINGITLGILPYGGTNAFAEALSTSVHEAAHLVDLATPGRPSLTGGRMGGNWAAESFAELVRFAWIARASRPLDNIFEQSLPLTVERRFGASNTWYACARPEAATLQYLRYLAAGPNTYPMICSYGAWLFQGQRGTPTRTLLLRFADALARARLTDLVPVFWGTSMPTLDRLGDFFASWIVPRTASSARTSSRFDLFDMRATLTMYGQPPIEGPSLTDGARDYNITQPGLAVWAWETQVAGVTRQTQFVQPGRSVGLDTTRMRVGLVRLP